MPPEDEPALPSHDAVLREARARVGAEAERRAAWMRSNLRSAMDHSRVNGTRLAVVDPLAKDFALIAAPDTMNFPLLIAVLLLASVGVSALGSGLSLRRFLRV